VRLTLLLLGIQFLVKIATDLNLPEREMYESELKNVNKRKEIQHQVLIRILKRRDCIGFILA
jgi:hypothetical protein